MATSATNLKPFELGFSTTNNKLYIGRSSGGPLVLNPDVNLNLSSATGTLPISKGGTGATSKNIALHNLFSNNIVTNINLNNLTDLGVYWCQLNTCVNSPSDGSIWGWIEVLPNTAGSNLVGLQRVHSYEKGKVWTRMYINSNWTTWKDHDNYLSLSGGTVGGNVTIHGTVNVGPFICASIELRNATPYIDFCFNSSSADYTLRLIESSKGILNVEGGLRATSNLYLSTVAKNDVFSQTDANGNKVASGIMSYPTTAGIYRNIAAGVTGMPSALSGYGTLVIFNGGGYHAHMYFSTSGSFAWTITEGDVNTVIKPTQWRYVNGTVTQST